MSLREASYLQPTPLHFALPSCPFSLLISTGDLLKAERPMVEGESEKG
jgi:hypothetical protein